MIFRLSKIKPLESFVAQKFSTRRQNFFELNPVYPSVGQKDFDIYNTEKTAIPVAGSYEDAMDRAYLLRKRLTEEFILKKYQKKKIEDNFDEETGFPVGLNEEYDSFIKRTKDIRKIGSNIDKQFTSLQCRLFKKLGAKSEIQLLKMFRINIAKSRMPGMKQKLQAYFVGNALAKAVQEKFPITPVEKNILQKVSEIKNQDAGKYKSKKTEQTEIDEITFGELLKELDKKISYMEWLIRSEQVSKYHVNLPEYNTLYGKRIWEETHNNDNYDLNFRMGFASWSQSTQPIVPESLSQDEHIRSRINKLYFLRCAQSLQYPKNVDPQAVIESNLLPMHIRNNDKFINELAQKYKEYDLIAEPDLEDIYQEVNIALSTIDVKISPDFAKKYEGSKENTEGKFYTTQKIVAKEDLLWKSINLDQVFCRNDYSERNIKSVILSQDEVKNLSPKSTVEMSLAKMPFDLHRHQDLQIFGVFTQHRRRIMKDYFKDSDFLPEQQFKYFSLTEAQQKLDRVTQTIHEKSQVYVGKGKRKSSESEVTMRLGTGKITVNKVSLADYFTDPYRRGEALKPLVIASIAGKVDLDIEVVGGGAHAQCECVSFAIADAIIQMNPEFKKQMYWFGLVGCDDRRKEPKRMGLYSARKRPPYVRR